MLYRCTAIHIPQTVLRTGLSHLIIVFIVVKQKPMNLLQSLEVLTIFMS